MIPKKLKPKTNFLIEITKIYDEILAKNKNSSLNLFFEDYF